MFKGFAFFILRKTGTWGDTFLRVAAGDRIWYA